MILPARLPDASNAAQWRCPAGKLARARAPGRATRPIGRVLQCRGPGAPGSAATCLPSIEISKGCRSSRTSSTSAASWARVRQARAARQPSRVRPRRRSPLARHALRAEPPGDDV